MRMDTYGVFVNVRKHSAYIIAHELYVTYGFIHNIFITME